MRTSHILFLFALAITVSGCITNTRKVNTPLDEHMRIVAATPERFHIIVTIPPDLAAPGTSTNGSTGDFPVASDGRVTFHVPQMRAGYKTWLCGFILMDDDTLFSYYVITIRQMEPNGGYSDFYSMRLTDLKRFPRDKEGYRVIHLD